MTTRVPIADSVRVPAPRLLAADVCGATDDERKPSRVVKAIDEFVSVGNVELSGSVTDGSWVLDNTSKGLVLV